MATAMTFDCPICMEEMRPPKKIFQCTEGHSLCEECKDRVSVCPTCRTDMGPGQMSRNFLAESMIREQVEGGNSNVDTEDYHHASAPTLEDFDKVSTLQYGFESLNLDQLDMLLLTTTGPAAEYQGDVFGVYRAAGLHNGVKYYRQVERSNKGRYMFQYNKDMWIVGSNLGKERGALQNLISSDTVPVTGWQYVGSGKWRHDEGIRVTPVEDEASVLCGDITITVSGEAKHVSRYAGVFKPTGEISKGRQLFRNPQTGKYLNVRPGGFTWGVRDYIDATQVGIRSGCAPDMCPASARASYSDRDNVKHWQYFANGWRDSAEIIVKCSKHSYPQN